MIIRKYDGSNWVAQSPKVNFTDVVADVTTEDGSGNPAPVSIFDSNNKLRVSYLPDHIYGGMKLIGTLSITGSPVAPFQLPALVSGTPVTGYTVSTNLESYLQTVNNDNTLTYSGGGFGNNVGDSFIGAFWVISGSSGVGVADTASSGSADWSSVAFDEGVAPSSGSYGLELTLEVGDFLVITDWDNSNSRFKVSVINNTNKVATAGSSEANSSPGIMTAAQAFKLSGIEASADVTDSANVTSSLVAATGISSSNKGTIRTNLGVDAAGTDNSTDVTLDTTQYDYLSINSFQRITLGQIDYSTDISGTPTIGNASITISGTTDQITVTNTGGAFTANDTADTTETFSLDYPVYYAGTEAALPTGSDVPTNAIGFEY